MNSTDLMRSLTRAEAFRNNERHRKNVSEANRLYKLGKLTECEAVLAKLPTDAQLLSELMEKLQGKSVASTIKKIVEGKVTNKYTAAKGYSSLLTHVLIECEQNRLEYGLLKEHLLQKIFQLI